MNGKKRTVEKLEIAPKTKVYRHVTVTEAGPVITPITGTQISRKKKNGEIEKGWCFRVQKYRDIFILSSDVEFGGMRVLYFGPPPNPQTWVGATLEGLREDGRCGSITLIHGDLEKDLYPIFSSEEEYIEKCTQQLKDLGQRCPEKLEKIFSGVLENALKNFSDNPLCGLLKPIFSQNTELARNVFLSAGVAFAKATCGGELHKAVVELQARAKGEEAAEKETFRADGWIENPIGEVILTPEEITQEDISNLREHFNKTHV